ncbi:hypothetical protein [Flavobacterium selenitireducens]|uniref:hypothetical protein n=1 Tax=Flavobacterium selenitireducens TaxID=2722704 RepID=UPI00168C0157|nr:hypothetical protein [Flavobacterium selenitireducens]MBD3583848.1 hypothetical protein [Flavobacterium selenitireducens]
MTRITGAILLLLFLMDCLSVRAQSFRKQRMTPVRTQNLPRKVSETSGLATFDRFIATHNDSGNAPKLYLIDTATASVAKAFELPVRNSDWEDITQDSLYLYIADIGNNYHQRPSLKIYRIDKNALSHDSISLDSIGFRWPENPRTGKVVNHNCEAVISYADSLYLFTKEEGRTSVFSIPNRPGEHQARFKSEFKTKIFITGAWISPNKPRLVLCGYTKMLRPYLIDFRNFDDTDFFDADITEIRIRKRFRQVEGITSFNGTDFYISNEHFRLPWLINKRQQLHLLKLKQ